MLICNVLTCRNLTRFLDRFNVVCENIQSAIKSQRTPDSQISLLCLVQLRSYRSLIPSLQWEYMKSVLCGVRSALSVSSTTQQCELYQRRHHQYASRTRAGHDISVHMTSQAPAGHVTLRHTLPTDDSALTCVGLGVLHTVYGHCPVVSIFYLSIYLFPRLISAAGDWMSTILPHMVWP